MNNFLAMDTSANYLTVAAIKDGKAYTVFKPDCAMRHAVSVMAAVEEALAKAEMSLQDCDFFAAVVGAGSFTGIRIGISAVKGFCSALGKPALGVTSFDVAAYNTIDDGRALCIVDALHDAYYACGYEGGEVVLPPAYLSEDEVLALTKEGYRLYACAPCAISEKAPLTLVDPAEGLVKATRALAEKKAFGKLSALYVRKSSAELNLENKG